MVKKERIRLLKKGEVKNGPVIYWMSRDQRVHDNWALLYAQSITLKNNVPLFVVFCLVPDFLEATIRQYGFMLKGLQFIENQCAKLNIPFILLTGDPSNEIPKFINKTGAGILVTDFDPLKVKKSWKRNVSAEIKVPFYEVDAHNIIPCFYASDKEEFAAYTIRPKLKRLLPDYLDEFPAIKRMKIDAGIKIEKINWDKIEASLKVDRNVKEVDWIKPGELEAQKSLHYFIHHKLKSYNEGRNDPNADAQSDLSPYLHFGQISAQRIALNVEQYTKQSPSTGAFLEEMIIRRELSDNFCYYNSSYDSFDGFKDWAKKTLNEHRKDKREYVYSLDEFEKAGTHEDLWNAAQRELTIRGKLHGYMRMYWAKKILEWSASPEEALSTAIYLNDKYELDGRDPNGYTGCAWSIGGIHDRAWAERPVFGKIRYMNRSGCKRKFDIEKYINRYL